MTDRYCRRCKRALTGSKNPRHCDTITAVKGAQGVTHDQCGGPVAWSKREAKA